MRSLHAFIKEEFGQRSIFLMQQLENLEKKMADYRNHRRFTIKCLTKEVIPVSIRLKTNIKTSKGLQIIRRAEKQLLNERIRSINNTLQLLMMKRNTCIEELKDTILDKEDDQKTFEECETLIKRVIECCHNKVMQRQKQKFEALQQKTSGHSNEGQHICSDNTTVDTRMWVKNLSDTPLTSKQERLLAQGPKFVIRPKNLQLENM